MYNKTLVTLSEYSEYETLLCFTKDEFHILKRLENKIQVSPEINDSNTLKYNLRAFQYV